jgi:hypothetical protein
MKPNNNHRYVYRISLSARFVFYMSGGGDLYRGKDKL